MRQGRCKRAWNAWNGKCFIAHPNAKSNVSRSSASLKKTQPQSSVETNDCALPAANNFQATFAPTHLAVFSSPFDGGIPVKSVTVNTRRVVKLMMLALALCCAESFCGANLLIRNGFAVERLRISGASANNNEPSFVFNDNVDCVTERLRLRTRELYYDRNISLDAKTRP